MISLVLLDDRVRSAFASLAAVLLGVALFRADIDGLDAFSSGRADISLYVAAMLFIVGVTVPFLGLRYVRNHPVRAVALYEFGGLAVLVIVAVLTAVSLEVSIILASPDGADAEAKKADETISAAVAAILTALIASVSRVDRLSFPGMLTKRTFQSIFKKVSFPDRPDIPPLAQSEDPKDGVSGWNWEARWARARKIEELLVGQSPPSP